MKTTSPTTPHSGQTNRIVFFGTEEFSAASLQALIESNYQVAAVVTKPDSRKGRGQTLVPPTVKLIANRHNIPVLQPSKLSEITDIIISMQPVAGVLVSFGKIIPQATIDLFSPGIINVHPSHLPKYRGPSPLEAAIINGDEETGISIMQLSAAMDAGPVYSFTPYVMHGDEVQTSFYETMAERGAQALMEALPFILDESLVPRPQNDEEATYCQLIQKSDGIINWNQPAINIERMIRAYHGWPRNRTIIGDIELIITKAQTVVSEHQKQPGTFEIIDEHEGTAIVYASEDALLIQSVKPVDKKEMPIRAFLAGYKQRLT